MYNLNFRLNSLALFSIFFSSHIVCLLYLIPEIIYFIFDFKKYSNENLYFVFILFLNHCFKDSLC